MKADQRQGLSATEVAARRQSAGWNEIPEGRKAHPLAVFVRQFTGLLVLILILAGAIAVYLGEVVDALAIGLVVLLNGILGFVQEWRAENALQALRAMMAPTALVLRDGEEQIVAARELVPGDIVILATGDRVPADIDLHETIQLKIDESVLTGESIAVDKDTSEEGHQLFAGTSVVEGRGEGIVTATGLNTEFGKIAKLTGGVSKQKTQLQVQLGRLAGQLGAVALLVASLVVGIGVWAGREAGELFMTGLSLAVAVVPEGLPAVVTITLALGATAMARQNAVVRRLQAIETLGAASVICTDKTGTLTENKMTATRMWMPHAEFSVTGTGYDPMGHVARDDQRIRASDDPCLEAALSTAALCNHANLRRHEGEWVMHGSPTESALVVLAHKGWVKLPDDQESVHEQPFSSERKRMSVLVGTPPTLHCKGAPEQILERCDRIATPNGPTVLDDAGHSRVIEAFHAMAEEGLRVIALASRPATDHTDTAEERLIFSALVGIIDPPRPEVKDAVRLAQSAGIRVIMITGDSPVTAQAIAGQLAIPVERALTGQEIENLSDDELREALTESVLFARARPAQKIRIVEALQAQNKIVAMTGDGVNDAPALKQADIGISMGQRGTAVARDASDLILLDDNFATIVTAIKEGRRQFDNVRKFVRYLLTSNAGEIVAILANILIGGPLIFLATQILWMNLVTDGVTAVALGLEKAEKGQMQRKPRAPATPIIGWDGLFFIVLFAIYTGSASLWIFYQTLPLGVEVARTAAFTAMIVFEKVSVFAFRSLRHPCSEIGWLSNPFLIVTLTITLLAQVAAVYWPPLQLLLHTAPLGQEQWMLIALLALPLIVIPEGVKIITRPKLA
jgi:Ca2+-transporting ATPase